MGREEELGILIELVSVRAGASSEDGEPQRAFVSALEQAGSPQGPGSISPDPCMATLCQTSPAAQEPTGPLLIRCSSKPPQPCPVGCLCLPKTTSTLPPQNHHPKKPSEKPHNTEHPPEKPQWAHRDLHGVRRTSHLQCWF